MRQVTITPRYTGAITEGVIEEMERYEGKYAKVERIGGKMDQFIKMMVYDKLVITGPRINVDRWESFGGSVKITG